jgi:hypothetical protein
VPFLIATIVFAISVAIARMHHPETFVPGCLVGFCSLFEFGSWIAVLIANIKYKSTSDAAIE